MPGRLRILTSPAGAKYNNKTYTSALTSFSERHVRKQPQSFAVFSSIVWIFPSNKQLLKGRVGSYRLVAQWISSLSRVSLTSPRRDHNSK